MTERKPAREVIIRQLVGDIEASHPEDWEALADCILSALAEAGYPVEAGPAMREALKGHESPQLWRIEWLATLLDEINAGRFGWVVHDEDPSATAEMVDNIRELVALSRAALAKEQSR